MSTRAWPSIGLLFLDELGSLGPWSSDRAPDWMRAHGQQGTLLAPPVTPPPVLALAGTANVVLISLAPELALRLV